MSGGLLSLASCVTWHRCGTQWVLNKCQIAELTPGKLGWKGLFRDSQDKREWLGLSVHLKLERSNNVGLTTFHVPLALSLQGSLFRTERWSSGERSLELGLLSWLLPCPQNCDPGVQGSFACCFCRAHPGHCPHEVILFGRSTY